MTTRRKQRLYLVLLVVTCVAVAVGLSLRAFQDNLLFFYTPTQLRAGEPPEGKKFRLGGMVTQGSVRREPGDLEVRFDVTDNRETVTVSYTGVLPDLFRDGQGVIALGTVGANGMFTAEEVLAKHDENYMPPEVAEALAREGQPAGNKPAAPEGPALN
jgi:cytochrome c-type biogenesis protein CcmE